MNRQQLGAHLQVASVFTMGLGFGLIIAGQYINHIFRINRMQGRCGCGERRGH